jgi:hypothetical protein
MKHIKLNIPTSSEEITLGRYLSYFQFVKDMKENAELNHTVRLKVVSIFCDVPMEFCRDQMNMDDIISISNDILEVLKGVDELATADPEPIVEFKGTRFGFIPRFTEMSGGEFIDLSAYISDMNNLNKLMAIMYRPITEEKENKAIHQTQYEIAEYKGSEPMATHFKLIPAYVALRAYFFLGGSYLILTSYFQASSKEKEVVK